jgi:hypothetical protein
MTDILDLKDIHAWDMRWIWALGLLLLAAALFPLLRSWLRRPKAAKGETVIPLTPLQAALKKLDELANSRLVESGQARRFYFGLSDLFREFIERELGIPACEATLEELRPKLRACEDLKPEQVRDAIWLLELADMAKFAKFVPSREEIVKSVKVCRDWVTQVAEAKRVRIASLEAEKVGA